jgi:hypothetical protein
MFGDDFDDIDKEINPGNDDEEMNYHEDDFEDFDKSTTMISERPEQNSVSGRILENNV